jgi:hypothetical protein
VDVELQGLYDQLANLSRELIANQELQAPVGYTHAALSTALWAIASLRQALAVDQQIAPLNTEK